MTPEQRAASVMVAWGWGLPLKAGEGVCHAPHRLDELEAWIAETIAIAIAEEREACAQIADAQAEECRASHTTNEPLELRKFRHGGEAFADEIAAAIRARTT